MTVAELIAELSKHDPTRIVVMSKDSEGNNYSPLSSFWVGAYRPESTHSGDVGLEVLTAENMQHGYCEDDVINDGHPAIILCPIR